VPRQLGAVAQFGRRVATSDQWEDVEFAAATQHTSGRAQAPPLATLVALFKLNEVELFDLENDALERNNLAVDRDKHRELLEAMNAKLNALIEKEVSEDIGQMLSGSVDGGWVVADGVNDV